MSACTWNSSHGEQCRFPGTLSAGLKGDGRWMCPHHFRGPDRQQADELVASSIRWSELPDRAQAWNDARRKQVYGDAFPPAIAKLREEIAARIKRAAALPQDREAA